ncbi:Os02g0608800, partial [Oryza sativa Japonica Group]
LGHDAVRALRQVDAIPADPLLGPRAHRRPARAAHPLHLEVVLAAARAAARVGQRRAVEPHLARALQHPHVRAEVVGVRDRGLRVRPPQLPDPLLQQHVVHLREQVETHEAPVPVVRRALRLVHRRQVARRATQREVARDHHPRRAHLEHLPRRAHHGPHHLRDEHHRLHHAGHHAPDVRGAAPSRPRPVRGEGVVVVVPADLAHHHQRARQLVAHLGGRLGGGAHEVPEPLELDAQGAVGVRRGDADPREGRRVEGGGAGDGEVDTVGEVGALVEVRVEQRQPEVLGEVVDHEVPVGAPPRGAADGRAVGRRHGVLHHGAGGRSFSEVVAGVRDGVPEV